MPDTLHTGPWRRDTHRTIVCACRHPDSSHRHDLKTSSPCSNGACGCQHLRPAYLYAREWRTVELPLDEATLNQWTGPTTAATTADDPAATPKT